MLFLLSSTCKHASEDNLTKIIYSQLIDNIINSYYNTRTLVNFPEIFFRVITIFTNLFTGLDKDCEYLLNRNSLIVKTEAILNYIILNYNDIVLINENIVNTLMHFISNVVTNTEEIILKFVEPIIFDKILKITNLTLMTYNSNPKKEILNYFENFFFYLFNSLLKIHNDNFKVLVNFISEDILKIIIQVYNYLMNNEMSDLHLILLNFIGLILEKTKQLNDNSANYTKVINYLSFNSINLYLERSICNDNIEISSVACKIITENWDPSYEHLEDHNNNNYEYIVDEEIDEY